MKKKIQKKLQKRGFTLIEVLVVSTIIVVVAAIGLVSYSGAQVGARDAQRRQDLDNTRTTLLLFILNRLIIVLIVVVLPVPGPPVKTITPFSNAALTACFCAAAR